jgi:hypothetical protein
MLNCTHCNDLRARLKPIPWAERDPRGRFTIDGVGHAGGHTALNVPAAEIMACDCGCHDTWKHWNVAKVGQLS